MTPEQVIKKTLAEFLGAEANLTDEHYDGLAHWIVGYLQRAGYVIVKSELIDGSGGAAAQGETPMRPLLEAPPEPQHSDGQDLAPPASNETP